MPEPVRQNVLQRIDEHGRLEELLRNPPLEIRQEEGRGIGLTLIPQGRLPLFFDIKTVNKCQIDESMITSIAPQHHDGTCFSEGAASGAAECALDSLALRGRLGMSRAIQCGGEGIPELVQEFMEEGGVSALHLLDNPFHQMVARDNSRIGPQHPAAPFLRGFRLLFKPCEPAL